jgi:hypothetical protein
VQANQASREEDQMSDGAGPSRDRPGRPRPWRARVLFAALAAVALLAAACSGSSSPSDAGLTYYQKTLAFAQCVRAHGVPGFPDPNSQGNFLLRPNNGFHMGSPQFDSANKTCQHLLPTNGESNAEQVKQAATQALKFTGCMRTNGVPGFPDPVVQTNGITWGSGSFNSHSPVFQSAQHACRRFLPGGGPP